MKNLIVKYFKSMLVLGLLFSLNISCERDISDDVELATFNNNPEVFIDGFSTGMEYYPYDNSYLEAFSVDDDAYDGSASMRFDIPNDSYAGAIFRDDNGGRDLSEYDALTFYAKGSVSGTVDAIGFGQDFIENKYAVSMDNTQLTTNWKKYIIPIPDPSKLTQSQGLIWYAEGEDSAYSIWLDEVKYETLGTIAQPRPKIYEGEDIVEEVFTGTSTTISGLSETFNLGSGEDVTLSVAPSYFSFNSSNPSVATVDEYGAVSIVGSGNAIITASLNGIEADGSLTIQSLGEFVHAPTPTWDAEDVISIFSDTYSNVSVDFYNGYWEPWQTTTSADFEVDGDNILNYLNFNFVGNQFSNPTIDASLMSHIHFDVFVPANTTNQMLKITLKDFGSDQADGGDDDTTIDMTYSGTQLLAGQWNSIDFSLTSFSNKDHFGQIIYENLGSDLSNFYLDNVYLYNDGSVIPSEPTTAAPNPTQSAANVISIFSDAYTDISGVDYNPNWGQSTLVTQETIEGNNTLVYSGLNYQGTDFAGNPQDVSGKTYLHLDYYTANSSSLNVYLISPGPIETAYSLSVPSDAEWTSIDIPLSAFSPVDLANIFQLKFDGNGDVYLDNIYFY